MNLKPNKRAIMMMETSLLLLLLLSCVAAAALPVGFEALEGCVQSARPFYARCLPADFPSRTFLVAPDDAQNASTISITAVRDNARGNRLFWFTGGDYYIGDGSSRNELYAARDAPVLANGTVKPNVFRCLPGERCTLHVAFYGYGAGNWLWGMELADSSGVAVTAAHAMVALYGVGTAAINCFVHSTKGKSGLITRGNPTGATGTAQVDAVNVAGLPVHWAYGLWAMHDGWGHVGGKLGNVRIETNPAWGRTPVADSALLDEGALCDDCCAVWSADGSPAQSNAHNHFYNTYFSGGRVTIGDMCCPIYDTCIEDCELVNADAVLFQRGRPFQARILRNRFVNSAVFDCEHLGDAPSKYLDPASSFEVTDNKFFVSPARGSSFYPGPRLTYALRTGVVPPNASSVGASREGYPLRPSDVFDRNEFFGNFSLGLSAGDPAGYDGDPNVCDRLTLFHNDLASWRTATSVAGNAFDSSSVVLPDPVAASRPVEARVVPNLMETERGLVFVDNWEAAVRVDLDLRPVVRPGVGFGVFAARCPFDTPLVAVAPNSVPTVNLEALSLPIRGVTNEAFLVLPAWSAQAHVQARAEVHTPPSAVTSVDPARGVPQSGGTEVTIRGSGFVCSALLRVRFGSFVVPGTFVSDTEIRAIVPKQQGRNTADQLGSGRTVEVAVANNCASFVSGNVTLSYDPSAPSLVWQGPLVAPVGGCDCARLGSISALDAPTPASSVPMPVRCEPVSTSHTVAGAATHTRTHTVARGSTTHSATEPSLVTVTRASSFPATTPEAGLATTFSPTTFSVGSISREEWQ